MFNGHVIAAVIPAYREEKLIAAVLRGIPELVDVIVVVDDGSPDGTSEQVLSVNDPRITLLRHDVNTGVGGAIVDGHRKALDLGADVCVVMAGDAQSDPAHLPALLEPVTAGGYGFAKANRFFSATSFDGMPRLRVAGSIALTFLTKMCSGYWNLVDPANGYTAIRSDVLARMDLDKLAAGYSFESDMLVWLNILDVPAIDVPAAAVYGEETSTMRIGRDGLRIGGTLIKGFWRRMWRKYILWSFSPVSLLLFSGLLLLAVSAAFGGAAILMSTPARPLPTATVLLSAGPGLMGFYMLIQALVLDIQATPKPAPQMLCCSSGGRTSALAAPERDAA